MCGRYVIVLRPSQVRQRLADLNMPADEAPDDDDEQLRQSYNFAPGYHGLIYRAATSDRGTDSTPFAEGESHDRGDGDQKPSPKKAKLSHPTSSQTSGAVDGHATRETKYKLQAAKWGLIPFWTKRPPDYGSMMRTINCRDDSLIENRGMWNTMKQRKRCIVVAEGFYEWLKKNGGKEKVPHFVKRKDGGLMCFAGLWDCVRYEGTGEEGGGEKLYTYTVITTDSNQQLKFLHDRMPVILEPGSEAMKLWLDPHNVGWNKELQGILKPFTGELECYPVDKAVGKVGNNSPSFVVPIDSKENKKNIANFFGTQKARAGEIAAKNAAVRKEDEVEKDEKEDRETATKAEDPESNAPLPKPKTESEEDLSQAIKREGIDDAAIIDAVDKQVEKDVQCETANIKDDDLLEAEKSPPRKLSKPAETLSPAKLSPAKSKARSATTNSTVAKTPTREGNAKITSFFGGGRT